MLLRFRYMASRFTDSVIVLIGFKCRRQNHIVKSRILSCENGRMGLKYL